MFCNLRTSEKERLIFITRRLFEINANLKEKKNVLAFRTHKLKYKKTFRFLSLSFFMT